MQKRHKRGGRTGHNDLPVVRLHVFMVGERPTTMVWCIIVAKEQATFGILAVVTVLGFCEAWFSPDKFHDEKLETLGKENRAFHKANVGSSLFLVKSRLHYLRA